MFDKSNIKYHIYLAVKQGLALLELLQITELVQRKFAIRVLPFLNNPKDLGPSYKMDLDFFFF